MDVDVDLIGWVDVGLGGTYGCTCGILYASIFRHIIYNSFSRKVSEPEAGRYRPKHVVFPC